MVRNGFAHILFLVLVVILLVGSVGGFLYIKSSYSRLTQESNPSPEASQTIQQSSNKVQEVSSSPILHQTPSHDPNHKPDTPEPESEDLPTPSELIEFKQWAIKYGIELYGTSKPVFFWTALDYKVNDQDVDLSLIKGVSRVYYGLKFLPDDILEVMRGKTIYFTTAPGRSTAIDKTPKGLNAGLFMAATTIYAQATVHEFAHIFELYAIEGGEGINNRVQNFPQFNMLLPEYRELFPSTEPIRPNIDYSQPIPEGYISYYATTNSTENFAEHFAYYVMEGPLFRQRLSNDQLLQAKYLFFKNKVFKGREY